MPAIFDRASVEGRRGVRARGRRHVPSQVVGELVGIPEEDWAADPRLGREVDGQSGPRVAGDSYLTAIGHVEMAIYAIQFAAQRRQELLGKTSPR